MVQVGTELPDMDQCSHQFSNGSPEILRLLASICIDILEIHQRALKVMTPRGMNLPA
jgi:hypothetical protein